MPIPPIATQYAVRSLQYASWWSLAEPGINQAAADFATGLTQKLAGLKPRAIVAKNPYLSRARAPANADELAARLIDAFLSSSEETMFGDCLERVAIEVSKAAKGGGKSAATGIDLEYTNLQGTNRTLVQIKSGPNWGNSSQHKKLVSDFQTATKVLRQGSLTVRCIEGICYGPSDTRDRGSHIRVVGNDFWQEISDWRDAGRAVLHIVGQHATQSLSQAKRDARQSVVDYLVEEGVVSNGVIDWDNLYGLIMAPPKRR